MTEPDLTAARPEIDVKAQEELLDAGVKGGHVSLVEAMLKALNTPEAEAKELLAQAYLSRVKVAELFLVPQVEGIVENPIQRMALETQIMADKAAAAFLTPPQAREAVSGGQKL